jgi:phosphotransferase system enzyme I (PtsP)
MPTRSSLAGPRVLLRRLREVMAERISGQERLDKITVLIAANMVAEVCSVYLLRADGVLELSSTEGLNKDAVHQTGLKVGEGLVGVIAASAEPLNLADAQKHPSFAYLPETGEEDYHSFLGVPVMRVGRVLGVLTVQNQARRSYSEEEVEALQTVAMVIAEMMAAGELQGVSRAGFDLEANRQLHLEGSGFAEGVGLGHVVLHEPRLIVTDMIAENIDQEIDRLDQAIARLRLSIDSIVESGDVAHHGEHRDILEAYRMFAYDRGWARRMREAIESGLTAEAAVERVQSDTRAKLMRQKDPLIRERLNDFDDLAYRLFRELSGEKWPAPGSDAR